MGVDEEEGLEVVDIDRCYTKTLGYILTSSVYGVCNSHYMLHFL